MKMTTIDKLNNLTNDGMIDMMYHHWKRYESVNSIWKNKVALWQKWIRLC